MKRKKGTCPKVKRKKGNVSQGETRAYCTPPSSNSKVAQTSLLHPLSPPTARLLRRAYCTPFLLQQQGCSDELTAPPFSPNSKVAQPSLLQSPSPLRARLLRHRCALVSTLAVRLHATQPEARAAVSQHCLRGKGGWNG